jgi:hypothetical protein
MVVDIKTIGERIIVSDVQVVFFAIIKTCAAIHFYCIRESQNLIKGECNEFGRMDNNELNRKLIILCPHHSLTSFLCFISKKHALAVSYLPFALIIMSNNRMSF